MDVGDSAEIPVAASPKSSITGPQQETKKREGRNPVEQAKETDLDWPRKVDLFGIGVSVTDYDSAANIIVRKGNADQGGIVSCHAAHAIVTFSDNAEMKKIANSFAMITPDGQPVRWAMNWLQKTRLSERVYGPELMLRVCEKAATNSTPIFLYGGTSESVQLLKENLELKYPNLHIAGIHSPPFRKLSEDELAADIKMINESNAKILFIGLGCPKQDLFAHSIRKLVNPVQICVGAAFDFHSGQLTMAPSWIQRSGLEWLFRLTKDPRRLWKRYLVTNSKFLWRLTKATFSRRQNPDDQASE